MEKSLFFEECPFSRGRTFLKRAKWVKVGALPYGLINFGWQSFIKFIGVIIHDRVIQDISCCRKNLSMFVLGFWAINQR